MSTSPRVIRFDPAPSTAPEIDHPRAERREVGDPERRTWVLYDNAAEGLATGIWECEPGRWRIAMGPHEHELFTVLQGRCRIHAADGTVTEAGPGEAIVLPAGFEGSFEVLEPLTKTYAIVDAA